MWSENNSITTSTISLVILSSILTSPPTRVSCGFYRTSNFITVTNDYVKKFADYAKYSRKRIYGMLCKISHYDKRRATWRAPRDSKENFAPDDANLSPCMTLYIYTIYINIFFSLVIFEITRWSEDCAEWARKTIVRESKVEGRSGSGGGGGKGKVVSARKRWNFKSR